MGIIVALRCGNVECVCVCVCVLLSHIPHASRRPIKTRFSAALLGPNEARHIGVDDDDNVGGEIK